MQATRDYLTSEDPSLLNFRRNDIIKLVNKSYTPHGWLKGCLNGKKGMFPIEYVKPVNRTELNDINKVNNLNINVKLSVGLKLDAMTKSNHLQIDNKTQTFLKSLKNNDNKNINNLKQRPPWR